MKTRALIVALGLAAVSGVASADTSLHTSQSGNVAEIYGRSGIPPVHANAVVTRTAQKVVPGPRTEQGPTAIAIGAGGYDVGHFGRS